MSLAPGRNANGKPFADDVRAPLSVARHVTPPHPCVYFPERTMRAVVVGTAPEDEPAVYTRLAPMGFRRSGSVYYAPRCEGCSACISLRVKAGDFVPSRRFRRVLRRNADLETLAVAPEDEPFEHFELYQRYIKERHPGGSMDPPSPTDYMQLTHPVGMETVALDIRQDGRLVASAVTDILDHGLAAVYTYFDPAMSDRSLGVFAILEQIAECRRRGLPYLYLGYWIEESDKMRYKADFRPAEVLIKGNWSALP